MKNYYQIIGVEINASPEEIKRAYLEKAKEYHPDRNSESPAANAMLTLINEAKEVLLDPTKRKEYDLKLNPNPIVKKVSTSRFIGIGLLGVFAGLAISFIGRKK